jgi:hypothetical protein
MRRGEGGGGGVRGRREEGKGRGDVCALSLIRMDVGHGCWFWRVVWCDMTCPEDGGEDELDAVRAEVAHDGTGRQGRRITDHVTRVTEAAEEEGQDDDDVGLEEQLQPVAQALEAEERALWREGGESEADEVRRRMKLDFA